MKRQIRFTRKVIEALPPAPADQGGREVEYTSMEAPPGLRLVVTRRGQKSWLYRYTMPRPSGPGVKRAIKIGVYPGLEPAEACRVALDLRAQIAQGIDPQEARHETAQEPTLDQFFQEDYYPHVMHSLRSAADVESRWRLHISKPFGHLRFKEVKTADIIRFHDAKKAQLCAATANRLLALLKRVFNVAVMMEKCDRNPCRGVRMHPEENIRDRTLQGDELRRFVSALAAEKNRPVADAFLFMLATAARREECMQLTWNEVSLEEGVWRLPASRAKGKKARLIPLNDLSLQALKARLAARNGPYVFPGRDGRPMGNPTRAFRRICHRAGISDLKIHDLRRSAASLILNARVRSGGGGRGGEGSGGNMTQAQKLLGHSSSTITATRYAFLADEQLWDASRRLSSAILEACSLVPETTS